MFWIMNIVLFGSMLGLVYTVPVQLVDSKVDIGQNPLNNQSVEEHSITEGQARSLQITGSIKISDFDEIQDVTTEKYHRVTNSFVYVLPNTPLVLDRHQTKPTEVVKVDTNREPIENEIMNDALNKDKIDDVDVFVNNATEIMPVVMSTMAAEIETIMISDITTMEMTTPEDSTPTTPMLVDVDTMPLMTTATILMDSQTSDATETSIMPNTITMVSNPTMDTFETITIKQTEAAVEPLMTTATVLMDSQTSEATETFTMTHTITMVSYSTMESVEIQTEAATPTMESSTLIDMLHIDKAEDSDAKMTTMQDYGPTTMMSVIPMTATTTMLAMSTTMVPDQTHETSTVSQQLQTPTPYSSEPLPTITATSVPLTSMSAIMNRPPIRPNSQDEPIVAMDDNETEIPTSTTMKSMVQKKTAKHKAAKGTCPAIRPSILAFVSTMIIVFLSLIML